MKVLKSWSTLDMLENNWPCPLDSVNKMVVDAFFQYIPSMRHWYYFQPMGNDEGMVAISHYISDIDAHVRITARVVICKYMGKLFVSKLKFVAYDNQTCTKGCLRAYKRWTFQYGVDPFCPFAFLISNCTGSMLQLHLGLSNFVSRSIFRYTEKLVSRTLGHILNPDMVQEIASRVNRWAVASSIEFDNWSLDAFQKVDHHVTRKTQIDRVGRSSYLMHCMAEYTVYGVVNAGPV